MPEKVQLRIDSPCAESWDRMQPNEEGRHCLSCQKTVVDLTGMSDQEIFDWLATRKGSFCGRLQEGRLNRQLAARPRTWSKGRPAVWIKGWPAVWRFLVAGLLVSSEARAQHKPASPPIVQVDRHSEGDGLVQGKMALAYLPRPDTLRGQVVDSGSGLPLVGVSVMTGPHTGYVTDTDGRFRIPLAAVSKERQLTITYVGYGEVVVNVDKTWRGAGEQVITLRMREEVTVGLMIVVKKNRRRKPENILADTLAVVRDTLAICGIGKKALLVYPNPVVHGGAITLSMRLERGGKYIAQLYNMAGTLEETMEIEGDLKTKAVLMNLPATLAAGIYVVRLSHRDSGKVYSQQVVVL